jgi:nucleoside-diphosphate-sugar epimerase
LWRLRHNTALLAAARSFWLNDPHRHPRPRKAYVSRPTASDKPAYDGRVDSNFIVQAFQNKDISIYGDGTQTRSFCYVDDLVEAFVRLMRTPDDITGPINLGNPAKFTIRELAETIVTLTNSSSRIIYTALPQDDPK